MPGHEGGPVLMTCAGARPGPGVPKLSAVATASSHRIAVIRISASIPEAATLHDAGKDLKIHSRLAPHSLSEGNGSPRSHVIEASGQCKAAMTVDPGIHSLLR